MPIEIEHRSTNKVLHTIDSDSLVGANLEDANLRDADLRGANLEGANLRGADLRDANLRDAYLRDAYLRDAYLEGANLEGANLRGADLRDADLRDVNLRGVNLWSANLWGADGIVQIQGSIPYTINITTKYIGIGCQWHTPEQWLAMSLDDIQKMDKKATKLWLDSLHTVIKTLMPFSEES